MTTTGRSTYSDDAPPLPGDHPHDPALPQDGAAGATKGDEKPIVALPPLTSAEVVSLQNIVRWVPPALVGYFFIAVGLLLLALRRGRLFDAILVVATLLLTIPPILGYRAQARARLRGFFREGDSTTNPAGEKQPSPEGKSGGPT
jgi:hypothetical protein